MNRKALIEKAKEEGAHVFIASKKLLKAALKEGLLEKVPEAKNSYKDRGGNYWLDQGPMPKLPKYQVARYVGAIPDHTDHEALLMRTVAKDVVKVQFNDPKHRFAHGWHAFPAKDWKIVK